LRFERRTRWRKDDGSLHLSDCRQGGEYHLAQRSRSVYGFVEADEIDPDVIEFFESTKQVADAPGETIESRHYDDIKSTYTSVAHKPIKRWP